MKQQPLLIEYGTKVYKISKKDMKVYRQIMADIDNGADLTPCIGRIKDIAYKYKPVAENVFSFFQVQELLQKQIQACAARVGRLPAEADDLQIIKTLNTTKPIKFGLYEPKTAKKIQGNFRGAN